MSENALLPEAGKILEIIPQTANEWTFRLAFDRPVRSGQFMQLSVPRIGEAPISISGIGEGFVDFTIRRVGHVTDGLFGLKKGDTIFLRGPYGNGWPIEKFRGKHVVIVAGGTGCACVKSLIDELYETPDYAKGVHLILGYKNRQCILFPASLKAWRAAPRFQTIYTLDNEVAEGWHKGLVTEFLKDIPFTDYGADCECVVIGPPVMMKFVGKGLLENGVGEEHIWMSFERKMSCAVGKCGHCRIDETYVCLDGPVFNYTTAKKLVD